MITDKRRGEQAQYFFSIYFFRFLFYFVGKLLVVIEVLAFDKTGFKERKMVTEASIFYSFLKLLFSFRFPCLFVWAKMAAVFGGLPLLSHHNDGVYSHQFFVYAQTRIRLLSVGIYLKFLFFLFRFPCFQFKLPRLTFTTHHFSYLFNIFHFAIYSRDAFFFFSFSCINRS